LNPSLTSKAASDNVALCYDWQQDMDRLGATALELVTWSVVAGSVALNADGRESMVAQDSIAVTYVSGGTAWELTQIACTVELDTGDVLTRTFTLAIHDGSQPTPTAPGTLANPLGNQI
jgi:hypothetical protein